MPNLRRGLPLAEPRFAHITQVMLRTLNNTLAHDFNSSERVTLIRLTDLMIQEMDEIVSDPEGTIQESLEAAQLAAAEAVVSAEESETAAVAAALSEVAAAASAAAAELSAELAEEARLLGATIGYATKADMDADLAHDEGKLALVTNDPTASNNGTYRKDGASGAGSWVLSADRVTSLEASVAAVLAESAETVAATNDYRINDSGTLFMSTDRVRSVKAQWNVNDLSSVFTFLGGSVNAGVGDFVGRVEDLSGNGQHITFLDARRPILRQRANGTYYLEGDGTAKYGSISGSADYFKFLHDGTGASACMVVAIEDTPAASTTRVVMHTNFNSTTVVGTGLALVTDASSKAYSMVRIGNGTSNVIARGGEIGDFRDDGLPQHIIWTYKSQTGVDYRHYLDGSQAVVAGTAESAAPSAADANNDFFLFTSSAGSYFNGEWSGGIISDVVWTDDERQAIGQWAMSLYGAGGYTLGVGDSHTYNNSYGQYLRDFHPARLEDLLRAEGYSRASVNKGISGDSTAEVISRLTNVVEAGPGDIAVLYVGTNDENAPTTVAASPAPTTTTFTVSSANGYYAAGGQIFVNGESATVLSRVGSDITLAAPLSSVPSAGDPVTIDTKANLITIGRRLRDAGYKKLIIGGMHYLNYATGGDEIGNPRAAGVALRALQESAAQTLDALYVDFHEYMEDLLIAGTYTDGDDLAWHVAIGNSHLNDTGEQILADAILAAMQERGWV